MVLIFKEIEIEFENGKQLTTIELYPSTFTTVDNYTIIDEKSTFLYAFHLYKEIKNTKYVDTYIVKARTLEIANKKLKQNSVRGFAFDGDFHKKFKQITEL